MESDKWHHLATVKAGGRSHLPLRWFRRSVYRHGSVGIFLAAIALIVMTCASAAEPTEETPEDTPPPGQLSAVKDILNLDIEQLSRVEVRPNSLQAEITSLTRTSEPIGRTPAAVYVVTQEMIQRCGARNIPEVLRTVPGVNVARINASAWAISIRGFNGRFANKLLIQVDGVAVYNPAQGGVYWERQYVMLEDVERIEVIRGPGSTVWGLNAVNGVINIITKSAKDTKGIYVDGGGGNQHAQFGDFRVGGQSGDLNWRVYGMGMADNNGAVPLPTIAADNTDMQQGGFRTDWTPTEYDTITFTGDFYQGADNQVGSYVPPASMTATTFCHTATAMTRWARKIDEDTDWAVQLYYWNPYSLGTNINTVETFDVDFMYHFVRDRHDVVVGCGYRNSQEKWVMINGPFGIEMAEWIPSYFVQDTITLVEDRWFITVGSKFDHDNINNFDYQPTGRLVWTPNEKTSIWGAVTRSIVTPALLQRIILIPKPENCMSYEIGARRQATERFFWELATFFNRYENLNEYDRRTYYPDTDGTGDSYGFEYNATYEVTEQWRLTGSYSFLVESLQYRPGLTPYVVEGGSPRNQAYFQSGWDLGENVTLDVMFRYVDSLPVGVSDYFCADVRLAWRPRQHLELSVVGQNLLAGNHYEFVRDSATPTEVVPGVYGMAQWRY